LAEINQHKGRIIDIHKNDIVSSNVVIGNVMRIIYIFLIGSCLIATSINANAWSNDKGLINNIWENGWDNKPDHICFELRRADNSIVLYGVRSAATAANKARVFSLLLTAQTANKPVEVYYHPDNSLGPACVIGDSITQSFGISNITIQP